MHPSGVMGIALESRVIPSSQSLNGFCIAAECRPADEVAGDFYLVVAPGAGRVSVVVGDACGRGREGAALLPEILPKARKLMHAGTRPGRILSELNRRARLVLPVDRFITAVALELDARVCTLTIANAGHVPAFTRSAGCLVQVVGHASGPPLGVVDGAVFREDCIPFRRGDSVVLMTDGVLEPLERDLCRMRTMKALLSTAPDGAGEISRWFLTALDRSWKGGRPDDTTLLCIEAIAAAAQAAPNLRWAS